MLLRKVIFPAIFCLLMGGAAFAAPPKQTSGLLTNARIMQMLKAGTSERTIIAMIRRFPDRLDDGPDALVTLRRAGASSRLLLELRASVQAARQRAKDAPAEEETVEVKRPAEEEAAAQEEGAPEERVYGPWSIGLGYPFIALKRDYTGYSAEGRIIARGAVKALALRGYWNYYDIAPVTGYAGLEAGYVRFGSGKYSGSAAELSPFLGLLYAASPAVGFSADVSPSLIFLPGGGTDSGFGKIGWAVNLGVFMRLPAGRPSEQEEAAPEAQEEQAQPAEAAAAKPVQEEEPAARRRKPAAFVPYDDYVADADEAVNDREYLRAEKLYANLLEALPDDDKRCIYLYERRGWLAVKRMDFETARDMYLKAADLMRSFSGYDTTSVRVYAGLGNAFEQLGKDALAIRYYKRALEICSDPHMRGQIETRLEHLQPE